jgi:hypothetical protein
MAVFEVPASEGEKKVNRFAFRHKGKVFSVPKLQYLSGEGADYLLLAAKEGYDEPRTTRDLIGIENPAAAEAVRKMANDQVLRTSAAWIEASATSLGESSGSEQS